MTVLRAVCPVEGEWSEPDSRMGVLWLWWMRHRAGETKRHPTEPTFLPVPEYSNT